MSTSVKAMPLAAKYLRAFRQCPHQSVENIVMPVRHVVGTGSPLGFLRRISAQSVTSAGPS